MERIPKFNSIEEVKAFISSTDSVGAIHFIDENGKSIQMPMDEFIEKVGLDKAAEFVYETTDASIGIQTSHEEIANIVKKFMNDRNSLTDDEKIILHLAAEGFAEEQIGIADGLMSVMTKAFLDFGEEFTSTYDGLLGILLTFMENAFVLSSDLKIHLNNPTYGEIIKSVKDQIIIPEDIDDASLLVGLINIIGERFIDNKITRNLKVDYYEFVKTLGLDAELIFGNELNSQENESTSNETIDIRKALKDRK